MVEKTLNTYDSLSSAQRQGDAKARQIAKYFCGTCHSKIVEHDGQLSVIFKLILPEQEPIVSPAIPLTAKLVPGPIEYFVRELHMKSANIASVS